MHDYKRPPIPKGILTLLTIVCLIPLIGAFVGLILICLGIFDYKDRKVIRIGALGIAVSVIVYGSLFYFLFHRGIFDDSRIKIAKEELKQLIIGIDFYKYRTGKYPDSLEQLEGKGYNYLIADPIQVINNDLEESTDFYYQQVDSGYYLFSSGLDGIPFTNDDILPELGKDSGIVKSGLMIEQNLYADTIIHECIETVYRILESSDRWKQYTKGLYERVRKNGGTSYGIILEGSPNPKRDTALRFSKTFDISLHESYPDHNSTIARFSFDPNKGRLYEYDTLNDSLILLSFDKRLLKYFYHACK